MANVIQGCGPAISVSPGFDGMEATVTLSFVAQMQEGRHPNHLCIHLGCARWPWHFRQHPLRIRSRRGWLRFSNCTNYDVAFQKEILRSPWRQTAPITRQRKETRSSSSPWMKGITLSATNRPPAGCDGRQKHRAITIASGEINADLRRMVSHPVSATRRAYSIHADDAPTVLCQWHQYPTLFGTRLTRLSAISNERWRN